MYNNDVRISVRSKQADVRDRNGRYYSLAVTGQFDLDEEGPSPLGLLKSNSKAHRSLTAAGQHLLLLFQAIELHSATCY